MLTHLDKPTNEITRSKLAAIQREQRRTIHPRGNKGRPTTKQPRTHVLTLHTNRQTHFRTSNKVKSTHSCTVPNLDRREITWSKLASILRAQRRKNKGRMHFLLHRLTKTKREPFNPEIASFTNEYAPRDLVVGSFSCTSAVLPYCPLCCTNEENPFIRSIPDCLQYFRAR